MAGNGSYPYLTRPSLLSVIHQLPMKCAYLAELEHQQVIIVQNINPFLKSQNCQGVESSHCNNYSVRDYNHDPAKDFNLIEGIRSKLK